MKLLTKIALLGVASGAGVSLLYAGPPTYGMPSDAAAQTRLMHAEATKEQAVDDLRHVVHLRELARRSRDVIRLNCVNDKYAQIQPMMNMLDHEMVELQMNAGIMREILTSGEAVRHLRDDAETCGGEALLSTESSSSFSSPSVTDSPYGELWMNTTVEAPGYASPFN